MRKIGILALAIVTAGAHASFDLMLLKGSDNRIYRYDPVNNVQLGSFASSSANDLIAADSQGKSYNLSTGGSAMRRYNYSSGELDGVSTVPISSRALELTSSGLWLMNGSQIRRYDLSGAFAQSYNLASGIAWRTMAVSGNNLIAVGFNATSNALSFQNLNMTTGVASSLLTSTLLGSSGGLFGKAAIGRNGFSPNGLLCFTYVNSSDALSLAYGSVDSLGQLLVAPSATTSIASTFARDSMMPAMVAGHSGLFLYGQDFTSPATLARVSRYDTFTLPSLNSSVTFNAPGGAFDFATFGSHPANIVAPEPGSLLALSAGVGLIARKRRILRKE